MIRAADIETRRKQAASRARPVLSVYLDVDQPYVADLRRGFEAALQSVLAF